ncbi:MAG: diheme cytochrome c [Deltaproteobacteria bacterium]|nr:diheme cytochrome c [Deltaproteobacteria bacterium]
MKIGRLILPFLAAVIAVAGLAAVHPAFADDDGKRGAGGGAVPENAAYKQECSSCHFLYMPGFLPGRSWEAIIKGSDKHFGENLGLDDKAKEELSAFLTANAAEKSGLEWSPKILKGIGADTPGRITEVPYIKKEHGKIKAAVFKRPAIGSFSNCGACHPKGGQGGFDEDAVSIPK